MRPLSIRGGSGLGDSLYVQAVARHIVRRDRCRLEVCSDWPDVFRPLREHVDVSPFRRNSADLVAHYTSRKGRTDTNQFQDCCHNAGIREPVDLAIDWQPTPSALLDELQAPGKPIVCVQLPRTPMGRTDGFGAELLPECRAIQYALDALKDRALLVQVGSGVPLYRFHGIDVDLAGRTRVTELLDVAAIATAFIGYCSFVIPLAESFAKPALLVWSRQGLRSPNQFVRQITPQKVLHRKTSRAVMDDAGADHIEEAARALLA